MARPSAHFVARRRWALGVAAHRTLLALPLARGGGTSHRRRLDSCHLPPPSAVLHRFCLRAGSTVARMGSFSVLTLFSGRHFMHVRRALALTLAVPVLLAGCSDDPEPKPKIPETTSSSPTPTPTESETPEAESPEDFIRRWVEAGDEMQATGETAEFEPCRGSARPAQTFADQVDGRLRRWRSSASSPAPRVSAHQAKIAVKPPTFDVDVERARDASRIKVRRRPAESFRQAASEYLTDPQARAGLAWHAGALRDRSDDSAAVHRRRCMALLGSAAGPGAVPAPRTLTGASRSGWHGRQR